MEETMKFLMTTALLSVLAMGAVEARPMMMGCDRPMMGEGVQNFYYYFGRGCNTSCDVATGIFGGPVRMVRGVTGMLD